MIHVRFQGRSYDLTERHVGIHRRAGDREVKAALARYFDLHHRAFEGYVVDRPKTGDMIVRPEAVYG